MIRHKPQAGGWGKISKIFVQYGLMGTFVHGQKVQLFNCCYVFVICLACVKSGYLVSLRINPEWDQLALLHHSGLAMNVPH